MSQVLKDQTEQFRLGGGVDPANAESVLDALIVETDEPLIADLLTAWDQKGIDADEIFEFAKLMRGRCTRVHSRHETFVDIVGTGGSNSKTFNVSTASAFVAAGAGLPVAKHGNKAATSNSGSADVLSALGVEPAVDAETAERCLNDIGICFMFAPNFHRLSPTLGKVRRGLGFPTIFNCVGPLCNPAGAPHQLIGVWGAALLPKMAEALSRLGTRRSWIVHGRDGLDEITLNGPTAVAEVENGAVKMFEITPDDFAISPATLDGLNVETPGQSADIIRHILHGRASNEGPESVVVMNAAAALYISGQAADLHAASRLAAASIESGDAGRKLDNLAIAVRR